MRYARDAFGNVLCAAALVAVRDCASERHFGAGYGDFDVRGVNAPVVCQTIVHILADAISRPSVVAGAAAALILLTPPRCFFVAKPRRDLV
jgi:hypothetical protein